MNRKVAVVTGTRAEYGCLYWVIHEIANAKDLSLQLLVTGAHLSPAFGRTVDLIRQDFPVEAEIDTLLSSDRRDSVAKAVALGVLGFADAFGRLRPDIALLIADRSETFAAAVAATTLGIPLAHISGGEATEGLMDDQFRHAITKMSHLHFASMDFYRERIIRMGENPDRVFTVGEPGLDHCIRSSLMEREELSKSVGLNFSRDVALVTFHPVTLELEQTGAYVDALLQALERFPDLQLLLTYPGADPTSQVIISAFERYVQSRREAVLLQNLGFRRYLSVLKHGAVMIGNSSSGIFEAPSFGFPVVNIGTRQGGRVRAANVIDTDYTAHGIAAGIAAALQPAFRASLAGLRNPYGDGNTAKRILEKLRTVDLPSLKYKKFFDA